ncbi:acetyl-CoA carboxylase carboxyl transferase subunit alpha/beta [Streptomyces phaeolivaceus]|uniref:Acetyl-coenzyme A carboxylase carboxyl transferase subunits beta/alpha n=1 Tax=Streptomyces phaeolivaceus TaxID=2653200 RepID=A0A5P8K167_9ACTN|nr:carboxyl transferase domain-containing protein [Streptomyces phaeolivaceus]QFQ96995.1 acetyl-CoA carboxylase carboxyl transferase subunit alpha/beta [Streptomyces phaeolivaceus]
MTDRRDSAREAIASLTDDFTELPTPQREYTPDGPLAWHGYDAARARAAERTGEEESVVWGRATIGPTPAVLISFEFGFLGGSLGERTGDRLEAAHTYARAHRLPVVSLVATGGSRMQEGMRALTQLQRVARESALTGAAGLPQISILRDPTTGGGWATLGAGADITLALPEAQVAFAGSRVRPPDADPTAYTAESQLTAGSIDAVIPPTALRDTLALYLNLLTTPSTAPAPPPQALRHPGRHRARPVPSRGAGLYQYAAPPRGATSHNAPAGAETQPPPAQKAPLPTTGWEAVQRARSPQRPHAETYLNTYFTRRAPLRGDRAGGTDPGMLCGFGEHEGRTIAYAAQCGTPTRPAGYRTATRLIRLADRLGIPVLTLIDTPGAANDAEAERQGAGPAIAELFTTVATARTPLTTLLIGEGGSGGALALAAPDNTWATPDSYFSVIAPEPAAAILKRPAHQAPATADELRLRPQDLVELGVVRGIVEPATPHPPP